MDSKDVREMIEKNPELARSLEVALRRNAGTEELASILANAGMDAGVTEDLLAECQRRRGEEIGFENLEPETLKLVAGGDGSHTGGCTNNYYNEPCSATVEKDSWCGSNDACLVFSSTYTYGKDDRYKCGTISFKY